MQADQEAANVTGAGFDQMAVGLKTAINEFQETQSPESLAGLIAAIKPIGDFGLKLWGLTTRYVRRHPVQTTVAVVAIGFIVASLLKPATPAIKSDRNY